MKESSKDLLILEQWEEIKRLREENHQLKVGLKKVPKSSQNSSIPPSKDQKKSQEEKPPQARSRDHHEGGRDLHSNPDHRISLQPECCPTCQGLLVEQTLQGVYDKYELPVIRPVVTQISR